jgi:hypothetical protein
MVSITAELEHAMKFAAGRGMRSLVACSPDSFVRCQSTWWE